MHWPTFSVIAGFVFALGLIILIVIVGLNQELERARQLKPRNTWPPISMIHDPG